MEWPWDHRGCKCTPCLVTSKMMISAPQNMERMKKRERNKEGVETEQKIHSEKEEQKTEQRRRLVRERNYKTDVRRGSSCKVLFLL